MIKILESDISKNILYEDWCNSSYKVFSKFKDEDFFSDKVQHIYFYSDINDDSVNELNCNGIPLSQHAYMLIYKKIEPEVIEVDGDSE